MASSRPSLTRCSSSESSASSNILVGSSARLNDGDDDDNDSSASTPPTSLSGSTEHAEKSSVLAASPRRRSGRVKNLEQPNYSLKTRRSLPSQPQRSVSELTGRTLVNDDDESHQERETTPFGHKLEQALNMEWELPAEPSPRKSPRGLQRKPSVKDKMKAAAKNVSTVLGKRSRDVVEAGKRTLSKIDPKQSKLLKELDLGKGGVLDEMDLDLEFAAPPMAKKPKLAQPVKDSKRSSSPLPTFSTKSRSLKKWQKEGLYAGQIHDGSKTQKGSRKERREAAILDVDAPARKKLMTLPMFKYLDAERDFVIPFDVYAPSLRKGDAKPKDWHQLNKNRLIGDAKELWAKDERHKESSYCFCQPGSAGEAGCDDDCLNRAMQYECNSTNCRLQPQDCGNRHFADLAQRMKKAGAYDIGVEILATENRGFGIRACRSFAPGQIIMEYTGEVITEAECQRRMREEYKNKQCYYLMELERGLVIDGTRGSKARFINHSCAPNCEVRMLKVGNTLRMGVFAGDTGVMTGEELSYDYNFDNFGTTHQPCYCGAATCRGYLGPRLNATEKKKQEKEEIEARKKAADDARRKAERQAQKKQADAARGSGWRGWVAVDDPETKARLRLEKAAREEREKYSARAQRIAARHEGRPAVKIESPKKFPLAARGAPPRKSMQPNRRRTTSSFANKHTIRQVEPESEGEEVIVAEVATISRLPSVSSKFHEDLTPPRTSSVLTLATRSEVLSKVDQTITVSSVKKSIELPSTEEFLTKPLKQESKEDLATNLMSMLDAANKTARDGADVVRAVSQAVKAGLKGATLGSNKFRQSTLNFARMS